MLTAKRNYLHKKEKDKTVQEIKLGSYLSDRLKATIRHYLTPEIQVTPSQQ